MKKLKFLSLISLLGVFYPLAAITVLALPGISASAVGQEVNIAIELDDVIDIRGYKIVINFDSSLLSCDAAAVGSLFGGQNIGWWNVDSSVPGEIDVECLIFGAGAYVTGPGILLNLDFTTLSSGSASLYFSEAKLYDPDGYIIPNIETEDFYIIIGMQPAYITGSCFLQGCYQDGVMQTNLTDHIPETSPYSADPVSLDFIPADMVDWVYLEIRQTADGETVKGQSMILNADGSITSPQMPYILFWNTRPQNYYLIIYHRNHLPIMSSSAITFSGSGTPVHYDFSVYSNLYGLGGAAHLGGSVYGMLAGDADQDGNIFPSDINENWRNEVGQTGYLSADFNLDGNVFPNDLNDFWRLNSGKSTVVP